MFTHDDSPLPHQMDLDEARSVVRRCADPADFDREVTLSEAKAALVTLGTALDSAELARQRAQATTRRLSARTTDDGASLRLGEDTGSPRHFLQGEPVHAGEPLLLLTTDGWLRVRYEWTFEPDRDPVGYVTLPGAFEEPQVPLRLAREARFMRPTARA